MKKLSVIGYQLSVICLLAALLTGCATKGFVRKSCYEAERNARNYTRETQAAAIDYADTIGSDLNSLKKTILKSSEIRMEMYRDTYLRKIEALEREAIRLKELIDPLSEE